MTDPTTDTATQRLFVSAALSTHAARSLDGRVLPESGARDLLELAVRLGAGADAVEQRYSLHFEPSYPGLTPGPETIRGGRRLLLACAASDEDGSPLGVIFTALIPGRPPRVSVAPPSTPIPGEWLLLGDLV